MTQTTMIHVRVDDETRVQAAEALQAIGLTVSEAVRLLLKRVVAEQALPLELKVPNAATREAIVEARRMARTRRARHATAQALFDDLEAPAGRKAR